MISSLFILPCQDDFSYSRVFISLGKFFSKDFIYLFMRDREREREAETQAEGEADSMQGARLGTGHGTGSSASRTTPQAAGGAKPLRHRGCPPNPSL